MRYGMVYGTHTSNSACLIILHRRFLLSARAYHAVTDNFFQSTLKPDATKPTATILLICVAKSVSLIPIEGYKGTREYAHVDLGEGRRKPEVVFSASRRRDSSGVL